MNNIIKLILGERRRITTQITADTSDVFTIENATYTLSTDKRVEDSGIPDVVDHDLIVTIQPKTVSVYILEFEFDVASEHIIRSIAINVINREGV